MRRVTSSPPFGGCYEHFAGPDELHGNMASGMQARWSGVTRLGRLLAQAARYRFGSLVAGGCAGPSGSILPWSSRNGG